MTHQELELAVLLIIEKAYCAKYVGELKIQDLLDCNDKPVGYKLQLGLNSPERPLTIQMQGTAKQFLKFVEKELRTRHLHTTSYYMGYKLPPKEDCDKNTSCCNEKEDRR